MKQLIGTILLIGLLPLFAAAQDSEYSKGQGYVYFAPGFAAAEGETGKGVAHIGGGGEGFFTRNLGLGADVGYLVPFEAFSDGIGTFSPNFVARFRAKSDKNKVEPFVTGGYTLFFRQGSANEVNFGGGANWWFKERVGLRIELRDNVMIPGGDVTTTHFVGLRIGVTFR
ncbi:MAG TPA: outer membrane beta-barrel protein [Terriglobia bacterium]|nr:outer membrane beta-barrel protein [Terriglobia bacterium]